jgi:hypothetical protein
MQGAEALVAEYHSSIEQYDKDDMGDKQIIDELTTRLQDDLSERHPYPILPTLPCLPHDMYPDNRDIPGVMAPAAMAPAAMDPAAMPPADGTCVLGDDGYSIDWLACLRACIAAICYGCAPVFCQWHNGIRHNMKT